MSNKKEPKEIDVVIHAVNPTMDVALGTIPQANGDGKREGVLVYMRSENGGDLTLFHDTVGSAHLMMGAYMDAEKYLHVIEEEGYDAACEQIEGDIKEDNDQWDNLPWDEPNE